MTIEKRGNSYRITQMKDGIRYRLSVDHKPTKREAEELMQEYIRTTSGMPQEGKGLSMGDACVAYIDLKSNVLSPNTIIGYRKVIKAMPDWFLSKKVEQITALDVQKVINDKAAVVSAKTIRNYHGFISAVLSVYRENLRLHTKMPLSGKFEPYTPTDDDVRKVLDAAKGTRYEIPYRLAVYGMRRGEICAITSEDLEGNWLHITKALAEDPAGGWLIKDIPKTSESIRKIYIDTELAEMIRSVGGPIYTGDPDRLTKSLHTIQKAQNVPNFRLHDFRAYYVSMAHKIGIPDKYIMRNCGFSNSVVMDRVYKRAQDDAASNYNEMYAQMLGGKLG